MIGTSTNLDDGPSSLRDVGGFLLFSHGWTWAFWGVAVLMSWEAFEFPGLVFVVLGEIGPMFGGIVMNGVIGDRVALRDLGRRIVDPRPIPRRW